MRFNKKYQEDVFKALEKADDLEKVKKNLIFKSPSPQKKKYLLISLSSVFAVIIVSLVVILSINYEDKYIPTYLKMEIVSDENKSKNKQSKLATGDNGDISYYTKPNDIITLAIYLDNPKQYEILSFSLSNYKYQSYEFKEGSNSEIIYIDLKVGSTPGVDSVYINELKYIKNNKIKNGKYKGDRNITFAVSYINIPSMSITKEQVDVTSILIDFKLTNYDNLINENTYYVANLLLDDFKTNEIKLDTKTKTIYFDNLNMNMTYEIKVVIKVDLLDGKGLQEITLFDKLYTTLRGVDKVLVEGTYDELKISLEKNYLVTKVHANLYLNDKLISSISDDNLNFKELYSDTTYKIEVVYEYQINGETIIDNLWLSGQTKAYNKPTVSGDLLYFEDMIYYSLGLDDPYNLVQKYKIELYGNGLLLKTFDKLEGNLTLEQAYQDLYIKLYLDYNLNDNKGIIEDYYIIRG